MYRLTNQEYLERSAQWGGGGLNNPIGVRLRCARRTLGLSLRELGERVGLTHAAIKKYEDGEIIPPAKRLQQLAEAIGARTDYFLMPTKVVFEQIKYRKCAALAKKRLEAIESKIIAQIERRMELEDLFPSFVWPHFSIPRDVPLHINDLSAIEKAANAIREAWSLGRTPIASVSDFLEKQGIRVFVIDVDAQAKKKFDGLAAWVNKIPIIVIDKDWPGDRQRFTLAHELGHLILAGRLTSSYDEEIACHQFACALLLPAELMKQKLGPRRQFIEPRELALLKEELGLSMAAILYRAQELGIISLRWLQWQLRYFRKQGWHLKEPGKPYPAEPLNSIEQLVFRALGENYIQADKAAELMNMPLDDFQALRTFKRNDLNLSSL